MLLNIKKPYFPPWDFHDKIRLSIKNDFSKGDANDG